MQLIAFLFRFGPLLFGVGFLAPVIAAILDAFHLTQVFGLAPLTFGLILGGVLGAIASIRKSWL
jgi:ABC-type dipeptide/oligopeptide/nickel transport system permease component